MSIFPKGFYWGAATASYQVEGFNENTDWAKAAKEGRVPPAGRLADHYHRYEEDFDNAKELGHNAHRFSIEWARIEPREGEFDQKEIEHYRQVLKALHEREITPFVTLWHFTLPLWFSETGGFERKDAPEIFARYCQKVTEELGELIPHVATMNEPNVYASHGYLFGAWPPFKQAQIFWKRLGKSDGTSERARPQVSFRHVLTYFKVERQLIRAHNQAYRAIKTAAPQVKVAVIKHVHVFTGRERWFDKFRARVMRYLQTYRFMNRVVDHCDEIGLNYYRYTLFGEIHNYIRTDMDWKAKPSGLYDALHILARYQKPIFVAEAGLADADDDLRGDYIEVQVNAAMRAKAEGVPVIGHLYWSLIDNYEWALGIEKKFGLVHINYQTLERTIRPSAWEYKKLIEQHSVE